MNFVNKIWVATVAMLSSMAIFGTVAMDTTRLFAPSDSVLYMHDVSTTQAFLPDGQVFDLALPHGLAHADPLPDATPWQNLRMYFAKSYAIFGHEKHPELVIGRHTDEIVSFIGSDSSLPGIAIHRLPSTLLVWSTEGEPIETMKATDREPLAVSEGRYGRADAPSVVLRTTVSHADDFLKLLTAFETPSKRSFPLGDGSAASEIIAETDSLVIESESGAIGEVRMPSSTHPVPALVELGTDASGVDVLILSDNSVAEEQSSLLLGKCPIQQLTSFVKAPFFALGTSRAGRLVFCAE